jgi:hypothetical protein
VLLSNMAFIEEIPSRFLVGEISDFILEECENNPENVKYLKYVKRF